jgi:hypothetical protein
MRIRSYPRTVLIVLWVAERQGRGTTGTAAACRSKEN